MPEGALPRDIWDRGLDEGERRMKRAAIGQASSGLVAGFEVMIALAVVFSLTGAVMTVTNAELAHAIGALPFGIAFVFISIGRSELFTENFLVPVGAWLARRGSFANLARLWAVTLAFNLIGLAILAWLLSLDGVLPPGALDAAGILSDKFLDRDFSSALASAVVAGVAITLYTWLILAVRSEAAGVVIALMIGYVLLLPVLNHAMVSSGEVFLALMAGTSEAGTWDVAWRLIVAIAGNTIGGVLFVTMTRLVQVAGEPRDPEHANGEPDD
jgi:formate/nitrite transporter FocA (FNT family)